MPKTPSNYIHLILKCVLWAIPLVTLFVHTTALYPYIAPRALLFRVLVGVATALFLYLCITHKEYRPRFSYIHYLFVIFLGITFIADMVGIHPFLSIWSSYEKMGGFISLFYYGLYFLILESVFKTKKDWRYFFISCVSVGILHFLISLLQLPGVDLMETYNNSKRAQGALGNPLYLALMSTSLIFISTYVAYTSKTIEVRRFFTFTSGLFLLLALLTGSRSVLMTFVVLGVISPFFYWRKIISHKKTFIILFVLLISSIYAGFLINPRLLSLEKKTIIPRIAIWEIAFESFKERPFLGWGQESFLTIFSSHYKSSEVAENVWFDRTHNVFLEQLVSTGLLGTLVFITFIGSILIIILRKKNTDNNLHIIWFLFIISYYTQLQVSFETLNSGILLYAVIAFIARDQAGFTEEIEAPAAHQNNYLAIFTCLLCLYIVHITNVMPYIQNISIMKNSMGSAFLPVEKITEEWHKTILYSKIHAHDARVRMALAVNTINQRKDLSSQNIAYFTQRSRLELLSEIEKNPLNYKLKVLLLNIDLILIKHDPLSITEVQKDITEARKNAPHMQILTDISEKIYKQAKISL